MGQNHFQRAKKMLNDSLNPEQRRAQRERMLELAETPLDEQPVDEQALLHALSQIVDDEGS